MDLLSSFWSSMFLTYSCKSDLSLHFLKTPKASVSSLLPLAVQLCLLKIRLYTNTSLQQQICSERNILPPELHFVNIMSKLFLAIVSAKSQKRNSTSRFNVHQRRLSFVLPKESALAIRYPLVATEARLLLFTLMFRHLVMLGKDCCLGSVTRSTRHKAFT